VHMHVVDAGKPPHQLVRLEIHAEGRVA